MGLDWTKLMIQSQVDGDGFLPDGAQTWGL